MAQQDLQQGRLIGAGTTDSGDSWDLAGATYTPKVSSEQLFVWEAHNPPGSFVPPHTHPEQDEFAYILEGSVEVQLDGETHQANEGDFVQIPRGILHSYTTSPDAPVRMLFAISPSGRLRGLFEAVDGETDVAEIVRESPKYGVIFAAPPVP